MKKRNFANRKELFRFFIARILDKSNRFCWAHLVGWALNPRNMPLRDCMNSEECRRDAERRGYCYCGKFYKKEDK